MRYGASVVVGGMSDGRDLAVKLFGRRIPLPEEQQPADKGVVADWASLTKGEKDASTGGNNTEVNAMLDAPEELAQIGLPDSSGLNNCIEDEHKTSTDITKEAYDPKPEQDNKETDITGEDVLKKPDKFLQCPRCNSMDTKFCYYNNYNVNQPRYFCKNCQRYWTSGGTMRNVPVGAGRRKNKHSATNYRHAVQVDSADLTHHQAPCGSSASEKPPLMVNGMVLKFGADAPDCESTSSVLNIEEQKKTEEPSCSSSITASKNAENDFSDIGNRNGVAPLHHLRCIPVPPLAYAWNPGWSDMALMSCCQPPMVTAPAFCAPIPFPILPASFWGCVPNWACGPWNIPLVGNKNGVLSPSSTVSTGNCFGYGSPTLGKHCRDAISSMDECRPEKSLWVPKTSRVDDIDEAARSSIFAVLGIKPDENGVFKAFSSKIKNGEAALHANPAALSRSQAFQETTN